MKSIRLRSAGFFGLHFDFHCGVTDQGVGARTTPAMVQAVLKTVKPDFVQIDCKGHPGISSYPTKAGNAAPGIVRDQLAVWRKVTRTAGVPLVMHYSGVQDEAALKHHPEWAATEPDGKADTKATSVFGPYADRLLIPQLTELAVEWQVDAVWVDGDCWGVAKDWSRWSLATWKLRHGDLPMPQAPADPRWVDFLDHCREGFHAYLRRYVDALHAAKPGFEVASNWAFTAFIPGPLSAAVDYISGDFTSTQSAQSARLHARYLMHQGKPWDLMAWGFGTHMDDLHAEKTATQLSQEAALVLSLGGGFQIYTQQQRDASVSPARLPVLAEVGRFCRARQALCHHAVSLNDVAVLASNDDWRRRSGHPFTIWWPGQQDLEGVLRLCLDARRHTTVLMDHHLDEHLASLRVVVLPDCHHLDAPVRDRLVAWLRGGGRILALGPNALTALAIPDLPITREGAIADGVRHLRAPNRAGGAEFAGQKGDGQLWKIGRTARVLTQLHASHAPESASSPGAVSCRVGRGRLVAVAVAMGSTYLDRTSSVSCALVQGWLRHLDPKPLVEVTGPGRVEVAVMRKDGELRINLTNLEGPHDAKQILAWDHIPPLGPLSVRVRLPVRGSVRWEPDGVRLPAKRTKDGLLITVPGVAIHGALCVKLA